ncbi:MAG: hypothetical protein A2X12_04600 [Bacteroidetes bacterium GWE2_29_8]|nr:MAG: hypothetical protein A2X12_04600 [Bacteroidetes bacterium GWE2_29_8]OFY18277.1 MAG: hypothetical protein A2X02_05850 [Bacteroidetes bacterium GWF2_29_10]
MSNIGLISVIVPCYNQANYLKDAVISLINQSYKEWECIIVNDGSSDNTEQVAKDLMDIDNRVTYVFQNNKGLPGARNTGLKIANGKYIQILDSDDIISSDKFEKQLSIMEQRANVDIVYCDYLSFTDDAPQDYFSFFKRQKIQEDALNDFIYNYEKEFITPVHIYLFRKSCFDRWGLYDESLKNYEDWDLYLRFASNKPNYYYMNENMAYYRRNTGGICSDTYTTVNWRIKVINKQLKSDILDEAQKRQLRFSLHDFVGKLGFEYIKIGEYAEGLKYTFKAMRLSGKYWYYGYNTVYWLKKQIFK